MDFSFLTCDVQDGQMCRDNNFAYLANYSTGDGGGVGDLALPQRIIEGVPVEYVEVDVGVGGLAVDGIGHADERIPVLLRYLGGYVAVGVGE